MIPSHPDGIPNSHEYTMTICVLAANSARVPKMWTTVCRLSLVFIQLQSDVKCLNRPESKDKNPYLPMLDECLIFLLQMKPLCCLLAMGPRNLESLAVLWSRKKIFLFSALLVW